MKNLKVLILVFGALGLIALLANHIGLMLEFDKSNTILMLLAFALPTIMGAMGAAKPPFMAWQAAVSVAGFALAAIKMRIWETLPHIADIPGWQFKVAMIAIIGGLIVSIMALVKPERA